MRASCRGLEPPARTAAASEAAASAVSPRVRRWCWLEDSNLPPLAYKASALPDELSQPWKMDKRIAAPLPVVEATLLGAPGSAPRPNLRRSRCQRARRQRRRSHSACEICAAGTRARMRARSRHTVGCLGGLRVVVRAICPSCLMRRRGWPCAGYSGFSLELRSVRSNEPEEPDTPCTRPRAASRSVDPTVRWRR